MSHHYATPGVYIEEINSPGVIAGVSTSITAFLGPALNGPVNTPVLISSWDEFEQIFGVADGARRRVTISAPRTFYLAHAVRGFFENGGGAAYIVRVGSTLHSWRDLPSTGGTGNSFRVAAKQEGVSGNNINVEVQTTSLANAITAARPSATIINASGNRVVVNNAAPFRPGDIVTRGSTAERQVIDRINYSTNEIFLTGNLLNAYNSGTLRADDLIIGQRTFRVDDSANLYPGSVVTVARNGTTGPYTVESKAGDFITLDRGLIDNYVMTSGAQVMVTSAEFNLLVTSAGAPNEDYLNLAMDRRHPRYYERMLQGSALIAPAVPANPTTDLAPNNRPAVLAASPLENGEDDNLASINAGHYQAAIKALEAVDEVSIVVMPDVTDPVTQSALIDHCVKMGDRFAILDAPPGLDITGVRAHRAGVQSERGFAALYYPWLVIQDVSGPAPVRLAVPPSGHIAGIYARVDSERGVHKAPANETIRAALGLDRSLTDEQQALINLEGINALRIFPGQSRPVVWGARTTVDPARSDWVYVSTRRLMLYIEESIEEGIRWAVFEPNNLQLWQKLKLVIGDFLDRVQRDGGLFGTPNQKGYYVRIDEALNPASQRMLGQLNIEIGVRPSFPAEFIIIRIGLMSNGSEISE